MGIARSSALPISQSWCTSAHMKLVLVSDALQRLSWKSGLKLMLITFLPVFAWFIFLTVPNLFGGLLIIADDAVEVASSDVVPVTRDSDTTIWSSARQHRAPERSLKRQRNTSKSSLTSLKHLCTSTSNFVKDKKGSCEGRRSCDGWGHSQHRTWSWCIARRGNGSTHTCSGEIMLAFWSLGARAVRFTGVGEILCSDGRSFHWPFVQHLQGARLAWIVVRCFQKQTCSGHSAALLRHVESRGLCMFLLDLSFIPLNWASSQLEEGRLWSLERDVHRKSWEESLRYEEKTILYLQNSSNVSRYPKSACIM